MNDPRQKAIDDMAGLRRFAEVIVEHSSNLVKQVRYSEEDHLGFMGLCFLSKQIDHMQSIFALLPNRDVILIARSMIEGLCQLLWAAKAPNIRPLQWRAYAYIYDWRLLKDKLEAGETIGPDHIETINNRVKEYGEQFLTSKAMKKRRMGKPLPPDPYRHTWTPENLSTICKDVDGNILYEKLYKPFSDWHHWNSSGIGQAINRDKNQVIYTSLSPEESATALATGFQCMLQTIELLDTHFKFGIAEDIDRIKREYMTFQNINGS